MFLVPVTAPATEPVSLGEAKAHLRVDISDDDALINNLIAAARRHIELTLCNRAFITQDWDYFLKEFPEGDTIEIPLPPLQSVTSLKYKDKDGVETILPTTEYIVDANATPGRVILAYGKSWPSFTPYPSNPVAIRFKAGYGAATAVPEEIKQAIKILVGHLYEYRELVVIGTILHEIPFTVYNLVASYRIHNFG